MNRSHTPGSVLRLAVAACLVVPTMLAADTGAAERAYTLYMGADIALEIDRAFYRVEDVNGSDFIVRIDGQRKLVPTFRNTARMRIDNELKLGGTPIALEDLKAERGYTPARDPRRKFDKMAASSAGASAGADLSTFTRNNAEVNLAGVTSNPLSTAGEIAAAQYQRDQAVQFESQSYAQMGSDMNSVAFHQQQMELELAEENYDAVSITFGVSSRIPLDQPYVLVIARIHERDEKPEVFRNWIFAQKLDPIGTNARRIHIKQGGLPVGFELVDYQVRLYNGGFELPTSHSPNSVQLTREEAQQYVTIEHLAAHKEATLPAVPALGELPADLKDRITAGEFAEPYYVMVDAQGKALGTFTDRECTRTVDDPYVESLVARVLFKPALEKGQPVPGVARVQLAKLVN